MRDWVTVLSFAIACRPEAPATEVAVDFRASGRDARSALPVSSPSAGAGPAQSSALPLETAEPSFRVCECEGACQPTPQFVESVSAEQLRQCEARNRGPGVVDLLFPKGTGPTATSSGPPDLRTVEQRVLDCFLPTSGVRLRKCSALPAEIGGALPLPTRCFEDAHTRGSAAWGVTEVSFRIDTGGHAHDLRVGRDDPALLKCISKTMAGGSYLSWANEAMPVRVRYVFDRPR